MSDIGIPNYASDEEEEINDEPSPVEKEIKELTNEKLIKLYLYSSKF